MYRRFGPKQKFTVAAPGISGRVEQVKKEKKKEKKIKRDKKEKEGAGPNIHTQLADPTVEVVAVSAEQSICADDSKKSQEERQIRKAARQERRTRKAEKLENSA